MKMNDRIYDLLKWIAGIWDFPYGEEVVGTITAIDAFLGALLGISTAGYNKRKGEETTK